MALSNEAQAKQFTRILRSMNQNMSTTALSSLRYVERLAATKDKLSDLKGLKLKGDISKNELGKYAKTLRKNLTSGEALVDSLMASTQAAKANIARKQAAACNRLDDSASILVATEYRKSSSSNKAQALRDPRILGALAKAGEFISGVSDEVLATAMDSYFKSDETPIGIEMAQLEADENVLKAIAQSISSTDNMLFNRELDNAIKQGEEIEKTATSATDEEPVDL